MTVRKKFSSPTNIFYMVSAILCSWVNRTAGQIGGQGQVQTLTPLPQAVQKNYGFPPYPHPYPNVLSRTMNVEPQDGGDSQSVKLDIWKSVGMKGLTPPENYNSGQLEDSNLNDKSKLNNPNRSKPFLGGRNNNNNRLRQAFENNLMRPKNTFGGGGGIGYGLDPTSVKTLVQYATQSLFLLRYYLYTVIISYVPFPYNMFLYAFGLGHLLVTGIEQHL